MGANIHSSALNKCSNGLVNRTLRIVVVIQDSREEFPDRLETGLLHTPESDEEALLLRSSSRPLKSRPRSARRAFARARRLGGVRLGWRDIEDFVEDTQRELGLVDRVGSCRGLSRSN